MNKQFETVSQMVKDLTGIYRSAIVQSGVSENEFWIWYSLIELEDEFTQQDICSMWSISKQTVNTIITNLVKKNLLVLNVIPGTRNRKKICPTEAGLEYGCNIVAPLF